MDSQEPVLMDRTLSPISANLIGIILTLVLFAATMGAYAAIWHENVLAMFTDSESPVRVLVFSLVVFFVSIVIHEGLHGLGYRMGGAAREQIQFGFKWRALAPYAHCTAILRADAYRLAVALPGIILGLIPLVIGFLGRLDWMVLYGTAMLAGAAGDLSILLLLLPISGDTLIRDHDTKPGFQILSQPKGD